MVVFYRKTCEASKYDSFHFFHMHHGHDDEVANLDDYRGPFLMEPDSLIPEPHDWALAMQPPGLVAQHQTVEPPLIPRRMSTLQPVSYVVRWL